MKDLLILNEFTDWFEYNDLIKVDPRIAKYYDLFNEYSNPTFKINDVTWKFSQFPSSSLIELLKQNKLMAMMIDKYFLNEEIFSHDDIEDNKIQLINFFLQINSKLKDCYWSNNINEFNSKFKEILDIINTFYKEIIPFDDYLDKNALTSEDLEKLDSNEKIRSIEFFSELTINLVEFTFNRSIEIKFSILEIIVNFFYPEDNKDEISDEDYDVESELRQQIEAFILLKTDEDE